MSLSQVSLSGPESPNGLGVQAYLRNGGLMEFSAASNIPQICTTVGRKCTFSLQDPFAHCDSFDDSRA